MTNFFHGSPLTRFSTMSFNVLIPKVPNPHSFNKFRPVSLCSMVVKIFLKIITTQLSWFINKVVSYQEGAFVLGKNIYENIYLAQEMVNSLNRKMVGDNMMIKIDMSKAYDRVHWRFLMKVLQNLGFSQHFRYLFN